MTRPLCYYPSQSSIFFNVQSHRLQTLFSKTSPFYCLRTFRIYHPKAPATNGQALEINKKQLRTYFENCVTEKMASRTYHLRTRSKAGVITQTGHVSDAPSQGDHGEDCGLSGGKTLKQWIPSLLSEPPSLYGRTVRP